MQHEEAEAAPAEEPVAQSFDGPQTTAPHACEFIDRLDPLNFVAVKVEPFYNDTKLGDATGFFYHVLLNGKPTFYLVTNWHVLTGRNADNPPMPLLKNGCLPNKLRLHVMLRLNQPEYSVEGAAPILFQEVTIELYDSDGLALWYQHPRKNAFDVGVINGSPFGESYHLVGVNQVANTNDMVIQLGNELFILGYPLGFTHFMKTPIWKRGSIASEPHLETTETRNRVVIDATTRQGMSGAPVIMRENTHYLSESGKIIRQVNATRFWAFTHLDRIFRRLLI